MPTSVTLRCKTLERREDGAYKYLYSLLSDGRVCVCEAMNHVWKNLWVNCCFIQILNKLLHLVKRETHRKKNTFRTETVCMTESEILGKTLVWCRKLLRKLHEAMKWCIYTCCSSRILMARSVEENIFTMTGMIFCWYSSADKYFPT